jgi:uncharacterized membrane protein YidH (DUF202 family)
VEVRSFHRTDLAMLAAAVGVHRSMFVSMVVMAIITERGLHLYIEHVGRHYVLVAVETEGDAIVDEHRLAVVWSEIDEATRLGLLRLYVDQMLAALERWQDRMTRQLLFS